MVEPNKSYFLQKVRNVWYQKDKYFDFGTEEALSHDEILEKGREMFSLVSVKHMGGPGYFLILNSLLFRLPKPLKYLIASLLIFIDSLFNKLPFGKWAYPYFVARWAKN